MKTLNYILITALSLLMFACQSDLADSGFNGNVDFELPDFEVSAKDAVKRFSHTPTGEVYVEIPNQAPVKIDFSFLDNHERDMVFQTSDKDFILSKDNHVIINTFTHRYDNANYAEDDTIQTLGQLVSVYNDFTQNYPGFMFAYESLLYPPKNGDYIYSTIEYLLAQACFQDDCSSTTRKAVLKAAIEKQSYKFREDRVDLNARKTGLFLMATILVKEKYIPFVAAVLEDPDLQNTLRMNTEYPLVRDKKFSDLVSQYAVQFLSNELNK